MQAAPPRVRVRIALPPPGGERGHSSPLSTGAAAEECEQRKTI
jgi:hypothetical protein